MAMIRAVLHVAALASIAEGQDPTTMATMMAGKLAAVAAGKAEQRIEDAIENPEMPPKCVGPGCCLGSTCMNLPGMRCKASRGDTTCVGSSAVAMVEGTCQCTVGACSPEGVCSATISQSSPGAPNQFLGAQSPSPAQQQHVSDANGQLQAPTGSNDSGASKGGLPVVPIGIALVVVNVLIWGGICIIRKRRSSYGGDTSEDEDRAPLYNRRFKGPGH
eukprot:gb/GFBE01000925.1/.p1 GENE.gb/GFBE01000925.1/~~gb/GFBE01000925.1/.p1  ORF type:complete len:218 (+),score=35.16 gb/GFBE01000925.1/:1-654(+)